MTQQPPFCEAAGQPATQPTPTNETTGQTTTKSADSRLICLSGLFITLLITSNLMAVKLITVGVIYLPASVICFPFCFAVSDLINEFYGFKTTRRVLWFAFIFNAIVVGFTVLATVLPPAGVYDGNEAFKSVFLSTPRILGASFTAFIVGGLLNSFFFDRIRKKNNFFVVRSSVSTLLAVIADSFIFITLAFAGALPFTGLMLMVCWQALAKLLVGIGLGTPLSLVSVKLINKAARKSGSKFL
ncbi:MAG: queuosine precursor transporter [Firmicutes bacterium]|nr:queuosine precursor transporter [Bacillota bacterium]